MCVVCTWLGLFSGDLSAEEKYHIFMRHRYNSCVELLLENIGHEVFQVKVSELIQVA